MRTKVIIGGLAAVAAGAVLSGCTQKALEPWNDAPVQRKDDGPAIIYSMPDGVNNFAGKCDGFGHRVFTTYHGDSPYGGIAVIADPACQR